MRKGGGVCCWEEDDEKKDDWPRFWKYNSPQLSVLKGQNTKYSVLDISVNLVFHQ